MFAAATALLALPATAAAVETRSLPLTQLAPADGASHVQSSYPWATDSEMIEFFADTPHQWRGTRYITLEVATQNVEGQDGTLAQDYTVDYDIIKASDAYPTQFRAKTQTYDSWVSRPGTYYWQAYVTEYDFTQNCSPCLYETPVRRITITAKQAPPPPAPPLPPAPLPPPPNPVQLPADHSSLIPSWIGVRNPYWIDLNAEDVPSDVDGSRWASVARRSARRWGMSIRRHTSRSPRLDGYLVLGFSWALPDRVLGEEQRWFKRARRCRNHRHRGGRRHRHCRMVRRLVDNDVAINANLQWQDGPAYPGRGQFDLETVVLHELGHYADNGHRRGCANSPLVDRGAPGEWWRAPQDWFRLGCTATAASRHGRRTPIGEKWHFRVVEKYVPENWKAGN